MLPKSIAPKTEYRPPADPIDTIRNLPDPLTATELDIPIGFVNFNPKILSPASQKEFTRVMSLLNRRYSFYNLPLFDQDITDAPYRDALIHAGLLARFIPDELHARADKNILVLTKKGLTYAQIFGSSQPLEYQEGHYLTLTELHEWLADRLITNGAHPMSLRQIRELVTRKDKPLPSTYEKGKKGMIYVEYTVIEPYFVYLVQEDFHRQYLRSQALSESAADKYQRSQVKHAALAFNVESVAKTMAERMLKLNPDRYKTCPNCKGRGWKIVPTEACTECKGLGIIEREQ